MFETGLPWYVPTAPEIHAFLYGFKDTFTRKTLVAWKDVPTEYGEASPLIVQQIQDKHHYYSAGFYTPRILFMTIVMVRLAVFTDLLNSKEAVSALFGMVFGV